MRCQRRCRPLRGFTGTVLVLFGADPLMTGANPFHHEGTLSALETNWLF
jgi:hypothetical protein